MSKTSIALELWESRKKDIIDRYVNKKESSEEIAKYYNCYGSTILTYLHKWNVEIRKDRYNSKYKIDINYFDKIDTQEKAYWIGFLLADGHISNRGIIMAVQTRDIDILEKLLISLKTDYKIKKDSHNNPCINIICKPIANRLREIGLNNRKSYYVDLNKVLSFIPLRLINHFIRGMVDGDGCIKKYEYSYLKKPQYHFGYTGLEYVCNYIKKYFNIDRKLIKESDITYTCVTRDLNKILEIRDILYKDAHIYLNRKYETFFSL